MRKILPAVLVLLVPALASAQAVSNRGMFVRDEGSNLGFARTLDMVGSTVSCGISGGVATCTFSAPTVTITHNSTPTSGCTAGGLFRSTSSVADCGPGLTYASGAFSVSGGAASDAIVSFAYGSTNRYRLFGADTGAGVTQETWAYHNAGGANKSSGAVFFDTTPSLQANSSWAALSMNGAAPYFFVGGDNKLALVSGESGAGTLRPITIGGYTGGAYTEWIGVATNGATTIGGAGITGTTVPLTVSRGSSSGNIANFQTTAGSTVSSIDNSGRFYPLSVVFASLGTPADGALVYCSDCAIANPCAGAGTGAMAKRLNGAWVCN